MIKSFADKQTEQFWVTGGDAYDVEICDYH